MVVRAYAGTPDNIVRVARIVRENDVFLKGLPIDFVISQINFHCGEIKRTRAEAGYFRTMGVVFTTFVNSIGEIEIKLSIDPSIFE